MYSVISLLSALPYFPEVSFIFAFKFNRISIPFAKTLVGQISINGKSLMISSLNVSRLSVNGICAAGLHKDTDRWRSKGRHKESKKIKKMWACVCILVSLLGLWPKLLSVLHLGTPSVFHSVSIRSSASSAHWLVMSQCCSPRWNKLLQGWPERRRWI